MKIALLVLSGESARARAQLEQRYPNAQIEVVPRDELEQMSAARRLSAVRALHPDIFAVATERLAWQRSQNPIMAFGALVARRTILLDSYGDIRDETRGKIISRLASRTAAELAASRLAVANSRLGLKELEQAIRKHESQIKFARNLGDGLKVAYLRSTPSAGSHAGGAATHINGFVNAATDLGAQVRVISNDCIAGLDPAKMTLVDPEPLGSTRAAFDLRNNLIFSTGVLREIERSPVDLIYQRYGRFTWAGVAASVNTGIPLFLEYNGSEVWIGKHWDRSGMIPLLERFERLNLDAAVRIFVVSEVERSNLLKAGVAEPKIVVNPNGVDVARFRPEVGGAEARRELGIGEREIVVGFVGTFGPWHGVLTLAEAITLLPVDAKVRFVLIGAGRFRDDVERIISNAGRTERVIFTGQVGHERVPALLDACDILLSPHVPLEDGSDFFGSPTKLFEYMAMGKAIVASRLGQIGDVLENDETALLVEPGNARQLAEAILQLTGSRELRERLGAAARQAAVERHTWQQNAQRVFNEYISVAQSETAAAL
jgi:glycosyltransferase involved in cell wall biosynthesis